MRNPVYRPQWMIVLTSVVVAGMSVASGETFPAFFAEQRPALAGQTLSASGVPALHGIVDSGRNADLRWPDFTPYKTEVAKLYETNGYSLLWVQNGRARPQGLAVIELLQNARANPQSKLRLEPGQWVTAKIRFAIDEKRNLSVLLPIKPGKAEVSAHWRQARYTWHRDGCTVETGYFSYDYQEDARPVSIEILK